MSYASTRLNTQNQFDLSTRYLNRTGKHLNESLDMKEIILPERRRANIREIKTVLRGLPSGWLTETSWSVNEVMAQIYYLKRQQPPFTHFKHTYRFISNVFDVMQKVLQEDFINVWEQMNLHNCATGFLVLYKIMHNSFDANHTETWQSALSLRLEEKLIASKTALQNLDRVHDAYNNAVPLVNNRVTPEGRYDFLCITSELFPQTLEINETYIHLRGHLQKYIQNISGLISLFNANCHKGHTCTQSYNYSAGFREDIVEYEKDLRKYESLVVRKPLKRILAEQKLFFNSKNERSLRINNSIVETDSLFHVVRTAEKRYREFTKTRVTDTIAEYLDNLKAKRLGSKLDLAGEIMSDRFTVPLETFMNTLSGIVYSLSKMVSSTNANHKDKCYVIIDASRCTLVRLFIVKMYDHYKNTTGPAKANMDKDFFYLENSTILMMLVRGELSWIDCWYFPKYVTPRMTRIQILTRLIKDLSLRNLTSYKKRLESFLETTRLDGQFFRYVLSYSQNKD